VLNADDPYVAAMAARTRARVLTFGMINDADVRADELQSRGLSGVDFRLSSGGRSVVTHSPLPSPALVSNALAAVAVCLNEGMSLEEAAGALAQAQVPSRLQVKRTRQGATLLDDCYNASPASMLAALAVLAETPGQRRLALLGDMLELGSAEAEGHERVGRRAAEVVDMLFTVGPRGPLIAAAARSAGAKVRHFDSKVEAVRELAELLQEGDVLLIKASHGVGLESVVAELSA
jgi:UDP-N-acetylmuramoyl-tripeptide--D-alanyl-D-alanine ligase